MQFKHPELLYALLLLIIPILVHLFQLRKFKEQAFTNVKFLKRVKLQTRKSSQLKKWLILLSRLCALAAIILAFAQPFLPSTTSALQEKENLIYLDNSFSMQQKNTQGELLKQNVQELLKNLPKNKEFTLFTNNKTYKNTTLTAIKNQLLQIEYSKEELSFSEVYLKAQQHFSKKSNTQKNLIAVSDFQQKNITDFPEIDSDYQVNLIPTQAEENLNISIDSVYIIEQNLDKIELSVVLKANKKNEQTFPVSLINTATKKLLAKSSVAFSENKETEVIFSLPQEEFVDAKITVEDDNLYYDNTFFFSLEKPKKITVAAIAEGDNNFISKIFKDQLKFNLQLFSEKNIDFSKVENADFILLSGLEKIPNGLGNILSKTQQNGSVIAIVPSENANISSYNNVLKSIGFGSFSSEISSDLKITGINFSHPLYKNVFNKRVNNFEYPSVKKSFQLQTTGNSVLNYSNSQAFLAEKNHVYVFSASLNSENSNFKNSPLIAPTFYNIAQQSLQLPQLYFSMGQTNTFDVPVELGNDQVLHISNKTQDFIPRQQKFNSKVQITTNELPDKAGQFTIVNKTDSIQQISFNYNRNESDLNFADLSTIKNIELSNTISTYFSESRSANEINQLWKWFVIFALLFLAIEVLLLKFLK
ncbi:BatA domain-containing protein [Mesonia aquimarina]|uniref:BatA domain-containing protein n=1 Tax=Mesonia aquimarina TaxID=1504967 RepID=UPI000EF5775D|nr:BatA domain-containing protein [Mesonia aquimarina]